MEERLSKFGAALAIVAGVLLVLALAPIGGIVGRLAMLGTMAMIIWLACRLVLYLNWEDKKYWEFNFSLGFWTIVLGLLTLFLMWANPPMPNLSTPCRVSRYESC